MATPTATRSRTMLNEATDDEYESDGPPGIVDSSSEEELGILGSDSEDDVADPFD